MTLSVIELRQYTLHPGRRDELIALFEREFVESQEAVGIHLIGLFRDLDDPDRFVWLRGFADMEARRQALEAFYFGPIWAAHRQAANATMIDSDNVLLLRPAEPLNGPDTIKDKPRDLSGQAAGVVLIGVHAFEAVECEALIGNLAELGLSPTAILMTEPAANTFPRLPIRDDGSFLVWVARAHDDTTATKAHNAITVGHLGKMPQLLRLEPTSRSRLRG